MAEGVFVVVHISEANVVAIVVDTRHKLHARRAAQRHGMHVLVKNAPLGQRVDVGRMVSRAAIAAETLLADVVGKVKHNVGTGLFGLLAATGERQQPETHGVDFSFHSIRV